MLSEDKEGMDSRWILEPGDALGRALVVMVIKGGGRRVVVVVGWKLRALIKDGVFTSHQVPVVPSVAGAEACRNGARGRGGASTDRGRAYRIPLKLTVSQSVGPSTLIYLFDPNLHCQPRDCPRHPPTWLSRRGSSSSTF